jgi:hypothetical protein
MRKPDRDSDERDKLDPAKQVVALRPLVVSGVIITKEHWLEQARTWLPQAADVEVSEDGQRFFVMFREDPPPEAMATS